MKEYKKIIDGKEVIKSAGQIVVRKDGMQTINPSEAQILADGWEIYERPIYTPTLEDVKRNKVDAILAYDSSEDVNEFTIGGVPMWLDKATRAGLKLKFEAEAQYAKSIGNESPMTELWYGVQRFELPLADAEQILLALEYYASRCYNNTQSHIAEVQKLESKEAVEAYDYTTGYPAKLAF